MPEAFIIHRFKYKENETAEWWNLYKKLDEMQLNQLHEIVAKNQFEEEIITGDIAIDNVLKYYYFKRDRPS